MNVKTTIGVLATCLGLVAGQTGDNVVAELRLRNESPEVADNVARVDRLAQVRLETPAQSVFASLKEQWDEKKQQPKPTPQHGPSASRPLPWHYHRSQPCDTCARLATDAPGPHSKAVTHPTSLSRDSPCYRDASGCLIL